MNPNELEILLTAKDTASGVLRAAAGVLTSELVGALAEAANAGAQEAASQEKVRVAVQNTNGTWDAQKDSINAVIDAGMQLGFHDEELNDSFALLVEQTGSTSEAMTRIKVAEDLARGAHIDLYTASKLLGKATDENANTLGRFGVQVAKGTDTVTMLAEVEKKFGGQATAYGATTAGAIDRTKVSIEQWQAAIGNALGPAQVYIALLPGISSGLGLVGGAIGSLLPWIIAKTAALWASVPAWTATAAASLATIAPFLLVISVVVLVVEAIIQVWETIQLVADNWDKVVYLMGQVWSAVWSAIVSVVQSAVNLILAPIRLIISAVQQAMSLLSQLPGISGIGNFLGGIGSAVFGGGQAEGGDYVVSRPTLFIAGDAGIERATFTPGGGSPGRGGGSGLTVNVNVGGSVVGVSDLQSVITNAVREGIRSGGFRGVIPGV